MRKYEPIILVVLALFVASMAISWLDFYDLEIFAMIIFALFIATIAVSWISFFRTNTLRKKVKRLETTIAELTAILEKAGIAVPQILKDKQPQVQTQPPPSEEITELPAEEITGQQPAKEIETATEATPGTEETAGSEAPTQQETEIVTETTPGSGFERKFAARLPVWIGGIAIALAGFFLVKYSMDHNFLTPLVRVIMGGLLGAALMYGADWIRQKTDFANGIRISQAMSGAGIVVLYVSIYAAATLYELIPASVGFSGMAVITAATLVLSLRHGVPIAMFGLIGGYVTPMLVSTDNPSIPVLFTYLYFVFTGLMIIIKRKRWWVLAIPSLLGVLAWVSALVTIGGLSAEDTTWLGLFLVAMSITIVVNSKDTHEKETEDDSGKLKPASILNYLGLSGAVILMGIITARSGFGFIEWALFGLLAVGGIGLAFFNDRLYSFVPWISMTVNAVMLVSWETPRTGDFATAVVIFAAIYMVAGYFLTWYARRPLLWAGLACATATGFYLLAYFKLYDTGFTDAIPLFWGVVALVLAGAAGKALYKIINSYQHTASKEQLLAVYTATVTAFISIALTIELDRDFLPVAFSMEMLAISWISTRTSIKVLPEICMALAIAFGILLLPQVMLLTQLSIYSLFGTQPGASPTVAVVQWPLFQLGIPALMFAGSSYYLRRDKDGTLVRALEATAIALFTIMTYYLVRHAFNTEVDYITDFITIEASFSERGTATNILFITGLASMFAGRYFNRMAASWSGIVLCAIALFRIVWFDLLLYNPLWSHQEIKGWFIFNTLWLPYGLPLLWTWLAGKELALFNKQQWSKYAQVFLLPLLLVLLSMHVRYFFQGGPYLDGDITTNAEVYSYSVVWLLLGVCLLLAGTLKHNKILRYASLIVILLTTGKVFLYDAGALDGLYRVFSFFGLGLSLLAISWFYSRFVFSDQDKPEAKIPSQ